MNNALVEMKILIDDSRKHVTAYTASIVGREVEKDRACVVVLIEEDI